MNEVAGTNDSPCPNDGDKIVGAFIIGCQKSAAEDPKILLIISPDDQVCLAWEEGAFPEQQPQSSDSYAEDVQRRALQAREAQERGNDVKRGSNSPRTDVHHLGPYAFSHSVLWLANLPHGLALLSSCAEALRQTRAAEHLRDVIGLRR